VTCVRISALKAVLHWLPGFNCNVEEWDAKRQNYETLAICRTIAL
jgi:hypothetical protein